MNFEAFKAEFDAKLASLSDAELVSALKEAGCEFTEPWLDAELLERELSIFDAANSDDLALAA